MAFKTLPTFYYHTHFMEFLDFVKGANAHLLSVEHLTFLKHFEQLSHLEQCTVVRLINRKYSVIKKQSLVFAEIPEFEQQLSRISEQGFATKVTAQYSHAFIEVLTKVELIDVYAQCAPLNMPCPPKSASKAVLLNHCMRLNKEKVANSSVANNYIVRLSDAHINYFLFLYFGHGNGKLNQFSMRDLGIMRTRDEQAQMQSRFSDFNTAYSCFCLQDVLHELKGKSFESFACIENTLSRLPQVTGDQAQNYYNSILLLIAKAMLPFNSQQAIDIIEPINSSEAQEFWCRQAYKLGFKEAVQTRLIELIDEPIGEHSMQFAEDFLARKFKQKRTSVLSDMLANSARNLLVDESYKGSVEQGVIAYYKSRGIQAWRTENRIWNDLFGLCFWHELFELDGLGLATAFDYLPMCIKHHNLMEVAGEQIQQRLNSIASSDDLMHLLSKNAAAHFGKGQGIVNWHTNILDKLQVLVKHAPLNALRSQLLLMCQNYKLYNDGYPDIMVLENDQLRFEEIKAQGDSLRRNQLLQIQSLQLNGIDVDLTTVGYTLDPMQAYAVVDIETTGGRAGTHKITEIGIVKMVNGEVVDQWQTLLNPQRHIPSMITQLTGINNDMVASAPLFVDIADELEAFTENCIFVAHNVNFDYGFIREEYNRINRHYKRPKLCTVQQMRKHYKGLASYSLANLTKHFNIGMQRHHRALSDAVAAAELLKLLNEKRAN